MSTFPGDEVTVLSKPKHSWSSNYVSGWGGERIDNEQMTVCYLEEENAMETNKGERG